MFGLKFAVFSAVQQDQQWLFIVFSFQLDLSSSCHHAFVMDFAGDKY